MALDWTRIIALSDDKTADTFGTERIILVTGQRGDKGERGEKGPKGDPGKGEKGDKGDPGSDTAKWGFISGDLADQTDLTEALGEKADVDDVEDALAQKANVSSITACSISSDYVTILSAITALKSQRGFPLSISKTGLSTYTDMPTADKTLEWCALYFGSSTHGTVQLTLFYPSGNIENVYYRCIVDNSWSGDWAVIHSAKWGNISGTLADQTDLQNAFDEAESRTTFKITGTVSSGNYTLSDSRINDEHWEVDQIYFATPSNVVSQIQWTTDITQHTVSLSATYAGATNVVVKMHWVQ